MVSAQALGAAGRRELAPRGRGVRGACVHSAQALGAVGLGCTAPRGLQVRERFVTFLIPFRLFCLGD